MVPVSAKANPKTPLPIAWATVVPESRTVNEPVAPAWPTLAPDSLSVGAGGTSSNAACATTVPLRAVADISVAVLATWVVVVYVGAARSPAVDALWPTLRPVTFHVIGRLTPSHNVVPGEATA